MSNTTILLHSGRYFDFENLDNEILSFEDIAYGLAMTCRFGGHCNRFYSVAEHCWWVSHLVPPEMALEGLLHDASESVLGDIPKPLKRIMPQYNEMEGQLEANIAKQYGIRFPYPPDIKVADSRMLVTEQEQLFDRKDTRVFFAAEPFDIKLFCWTPEEAKCNFLSRFDILGSRLVGNYDASAIEVLQGLDPVVKRNDHHVTD